MSKQSSATRKKASQKQYSGRDHLDKEELEDLQECFNLFDEDKNGLIEPNEIKKALESLGLDKRNQIVSHMLDDLQEPGGAIDFDTFVDIITSRLGDTKTKTGVEKLFNLYDGNETGVIDFDNIKKIAKELGETMTDQELSDMMHHIHVLNRTENPDQISLEEFYNIITKKNY